MGIIAHHAIVVTGSYDNWPQKAHDKAVSIFPAEQVSELSPEVTNGYRSFAVFPDGSKEGWGQSEDGDANRNAFITWLYEQEYDDHSSPLKWVEINYGEIGAHNGARITRSTWRNRG